MTFKNYFFCFIYFFFIIIHPSLSEEKKLDIDLMIFDEFVSSEFEKSFHDIKKMEDFLEKFKLSLLEKKYHPSASHYNVAIFENLIRKNKSINLDEFKKNLTIHIKTIEFNKADNIKYYLLNLAQLFKISDEKISKFLNTKDGQIIQCIFIKRPCNSDISHLFKEDKNLYFLSFALDTLEALDKNKSAIISDKLFNTIFQNNFLSLDYKLKIFYDLKLSLSEFLNKKIEYKVFNLINQLNDEEIERILLNKNNFDKFRSLTLGQYLDDIENLNKNYNFKNNLIFYNNRINKFLKQHPEKINSPYLIEYMLEIHYLDPEYNANEIVWHRLFKHMERKAKVLKGVGSPLHLKTLNLLVKTSSVHEPFLVESLIPHIINYFENEENTDKSLDNIFSTYVRHLKKKNDLNKIINLYEQKIITEKDKLKMPDKNIDKKINDMLIRSSFFLICDYSYLLSQYYLEKNNFDKSFNVIESECYKLLDKLEKTTSKKIFVDIVFQRNYLAVMNNYINKTNIKIDQKKLTQYLNDENLDFTQKVKILIPITLSDKNFKKFNIFLKEYLFKNEDLFENEKFHEIKFILKLSESMLPTLLLKNSGISDEDYFKLHKIIYKLIINQMIFDTKSIAYDKNYSTTTKATSSLIKQFGQATGVSVDKKTYSLLTQLLVYQYAVEKNKQNPKNSDLLRLMILSKFSHSESLINLRSVFKDKNKKKINEYLKFKNQIINSSISENKKQKNLNSLINRYIDLSINNEDVYLKSNLKYVKSLFAFDNDIISLIQSNLYDDQLYLNYYHMKDLNSLILFSISKNKTHIEIIKEAKTIEKTINNFTDVLVGKKQKFSLKDAYLIKEKLIPSKILNGKIKNLRLSLDSFLYKLPFAALPLNWNSTTLFPAKYISQRGINNNEGKVSFKLSKLEGIKWINDKYNITLVPSTIRFKKEQLENKSKTISFLGIGNPDYSSSELKLSKLPDTKEEISSISKLFSKNNQTILIGQKASEQELSKVVKNNFDVITFATHGFMSGEYSPYAEPGLALTKMSKSSYDGYLSSSEIINLNFKSKWILLNACNTFNNLNPNLNPFSGLPSSFLSAGAEGIMSTLWPIETKSAAKLSYYSIKNYSKNMLRSNALTKGQKTLREKYKSLWAHPYYWAPYINAESTIN